MSKEELMDRLLVSQAEIDAWKMKTGRLDENEFTKLSDAMGELYETPLYIDDTPGCPFWRCGPKPEDCRRSMDYG